MVHSHQSVAAPTPKYQHLLLLDFVVKSDFVAYFKRQIAVVASNPFLVGEHLREVRKTSIDSIIVKKMDTPH